MNTGKEHYIDAISQLTGELIDNMVKITVIVHFGQANKWETISHKIIFDELDSWLQETKDLLPENAPQYLHDLVLWARDRTEYHLGVGKK